jgi:hypothetical protein
MFRLTRTGPWADLEQRVREVVLRGDPSVRPYAEAHIELAEVEVKELAPLAYYVLRDRLGIVSYVREGLRSDHQIDPLQLEGLVEYEDGDGRRWRLAPPIVEVAGGTGVEPLTRLQAVVDGLHRCFVAGSLGLDTARVVAITGVRYPLVCLPLTWPEVALMDNVPEVKRKYAFASAQQCQAQHPEFADKITEDNYQYFFYRDLQNLGSEGIRE